MIKNELNEIKKKECNKIIMRMLSFVFADIF
jgi:hypothetical protein